MYFLAAMRRLVLGEHVIERLEQLEEQGQFGVVYRGWMGDTCVAVKELKNVPQQIAAREIASLESLKQHAHSNIAEFKFAYHKKETNTYYIVSEFVSGGTLSKYLTKHRELQTENPALWERTIKSFFTQILDCIFFLQSRGILHRDLKPDNILLSQDDGPPEDITVKIIDFGLSRNISAKHITMTKAVIGRP